MAPACLWSVLAFILNLVWEIAQVRLYKIWDAAASDSQDDSRGTQGTERLDRIWLLDCGPIPGFSRKEIR